MRAQCSPLPAPSQVSHDGGAMDLEENREFIDGRTLLTAAHEIGDRVVAGSVLNLSSLR